MGFIEGTFMEFMLMRFSIFAVPADRFDVPGKPAAHDFVLIRATRTFFKGPQVSQVLIRAYLV